MIRKIFKYVGIAVACLVVVALSSALSYRKYLQYKVAQERAISSPDGINSLEPVRIGGIDQWIEVRANTRTIPFFCSSMVAPALLLFQWRALFRAPGRNTSL